MNDRFHMQSLMSHSAIYRIHRQMLRMRTTHAGWLLTNFYWDQRFFANRIGFVLGILDATDYVDVYGLINPWTDFVNLVFANNPTIPAPNQGLGVAARGNITENFYVLAGLADSNGDPTDPLDGFDMFFNDAEYFKHVEVGWISSWQRRFQDNIHITGWQADSRDKAQVPSGYGVAVSASYLFADRWLPFARFGYSDGGGGAFVQCAASTGVGYYLRQRSDAIGLGLSWGRPSRKTFGSGLRDQ